MIKPSLEPLSPAELAATPRPPTEPETTVITPVPTHAGDPYVAASGLLGCEPDSIWLYHDASGSLLHAIVRVDQKYGKKILPLSWCRSDHKESWAFKTHPAPRPLYGLDHLAARPHASVVIVEGEKCVEAARAVFPDSVVVTSSGGASAAKHTDWSPMSSRAHALIWPDADLAGKTYAEEVASQLAPLGIADIRVVDPHLIKTESGECKQKPEGWDVADAIDEGAAPEFLRVAAVEAAREFQLPPQYISFGAFSMSERDGLVFKKEGNEGEPPDIIFVSGPFEIIGRGRDKNSQEWGRYLRWKDDDGRGHLHQVKDADLHGDARQLAGTLASNGLRISTAARPLLIEYLNRAQVDRRIAVVNSTGWHVVGGNPVFVLPHKTLGEQGNEVVLLDTPGKSRYAASGTLEDWKNTVGTLSKGQRLIVVAISASLSGTLLHPLGMEGVGINYFGLSSRGKSTSGEVAASVWGKGASPGYVATWRATGNGIEGAAALASDTCLILDEIGLVEAREAAAAVYLLIGGGGKLRSNRNGSLKEPAGWRITVFSTGEMPMAAKITEDRNRKAQAGQQIRMLDVPADAGSGFGVFDNTGPFDSAGALSDGLKAAARTNFGTAGPAFIARLLAADHKLVTEALQASITAFVKRHVAAGSDGQVLRAAQKFGLIGAAGELAREFGVVPWDEGEAFEAVASVFKMWLAERGGSGAAETRDAIARVRFFLETHGDSRFESTDKVSFDRDVVNRAGWKKGKGAERRWLIPAEVWRQEICAGRDPSQTARALADAGFLERASDGLMQVHKIDGRPQRAYTITAAILEAGQ